MLATEPTAAGHFPPGHSGNPAGRPPGARNRSTLALEDALVARADALAEALVRAAGEGKRAALRICFDRLAPARNGRPVPFALPPLSGRGDVVAAATGIMAAMAGGDLTPPEARDILGVLETFATLAASQSLPGRAPSADAGSRRAPADSCYSQGFAATAGAEASAGRATSAATPDPAPPAEAGARAPAETCKPSGSAAAADAGIAASDRAPVPPAAPAPAPPTVAARREPQVPADSCGSPRSASEAGAAASTAPPHRPMPAPMPLTPSSGDPIADQRYLRARDHAKAGDLMAAHELLRQTVERAPHFSPAWFMLGDVRDRLHDRAGAVAAYCKAIEADPRHSHAALAPRIDLSGSTVTRQPPHQHGRTPSPHSGRM